MRTELKPAFSNKKTLLLLSLISTVLGVLSCLVGELALPLLIGVLSAIYLFDTKSKRAFSIVASVILVALNVAAILFKLSVSLFSPCAIILSLIVWFAFVKNHNKADSSYIATLVCAAFILIGALFLAMVEQDSFTFDAAISYYKDLVEYIRVTFVDTLFEMYSLYDIEITKEALIELFDYQVNMMISFLIISAFFIVGVSLKVFGAIVLICANEKEHIKSWRFYASPVYAYFYVLLVIVSIFINSADSVFAISVLNLYNIFMVVFAYVGFNFALSLLRRRMRPIIAFLVLALTTLLFSSFALQLLAAAGVLFGVRRNNETPSIEQ